MIFPLHSLVGQREPTHCTMWIVPRASQEMPQLQITDQAKHVWRWALRGINSPPFPPNALTPATTFITGRENIVSCSLTNTCQFQEKELLSSVVEEKKTNKQESVLDQQGERMHCLHPGLFSHLFLFLTASPFSLHYFSLFHPLSLFGHWVLPCHSSDSSPHNSNGAEILSVIRYGNSTVISQMMPRYTDQTTCQRITLKKKRHRKKRRCNSTRLLWDVRFEFIPEPS